MCRQMKMEESYVMCIIFWPGNFLRREGLRRPPQTSFLKRQTRNSIESVCIVERMTSEISDNVNKLHCTFYSFIYLLRMTSRVTFKSRLKLHCSRPVTTPDFTASSQHRALDSLAIYIRALMSFTLHYITLHYNKTVCNAV